MIYKLVFLLVTISINLLPSVSFSSPNYAAETRRVFKEFEKFENGGIRVEAYIKFDSGEKKLAKSSKRFLKKIASRIADIEYEIFKKSKATIFIDIIGHADNKGDTKSNKVLSINRAISVYNYLLDFGFTKDKMRYSGKGEKNPKYSNKDYWGKWHNRRVDLIIIKKVKLDINF